LKNKTPRPYDESELWLRNSSDDKKKFEGNELEDGVERFRIWKQSSLVKSFWVG